MKYDVRKLRARAKKLGASIEYVRNVELVRGLSTGWIVGGVFAGNYESADSRLDYIEELRINEGGARK